MRARRSPVARGIGSRTIVMRSIEFAEMSHTNEPSVRELCRAWGVSGSRLRDEVGLADPTACSVTDIAASLGVTEFGRTSGCRLR